MVLGNGGLPSGFRAGTRTTLRSAATLVGDIVNLGNGASLSRRTIEDLSGRLGGNLVVVSSRGPSDVVSATVDYCELVNPNGAGTAFNGPSGRGLVVITRNARQLNPPAPHAGAVVAVQMRGSIVRSSGNGTGIFAINFAPHAQVDANNGDHADRNKTPRHCASVDSQAQQAATVRSGGAPVAQ